MEEMFCMRSVCYDSVFLDTKSEYPLFDDSDDCQSNERIITISEKEIVSWFFAHPYKLADYLFYEELGLPSTYAPKFEVRKPVIKDNGKPGDIDILMVDKDRPQYSVGIQVKRVRARREWDESVTLQTTQVPTVVEQTKKMYDKYRFHKSFVMLVILFDAADHPHDKQMFRHLGYDEKKCVYRFAGLGDLPDEVGIYFLEISQPSKNSINETARASAKMLKAARPVDQLENTTANIIKMIRG